MDETNGWYRLGYKGLKDFGIGPWDRSKCVLEGGYGFWSVYNKDIQKVFYALLQMLESNDPKIRKHVVEHYEFDHWNQHKRVRSRDFNNKENPDTQSVLIEFLPSLYFMLDIK